MKSTAWNAFLTLFFKAPVHFHLSTLKIDCYQNAVFSPKTDKDSSFETFFQSLTGVLGNLAVSVWYAKLHFKSLVFEWKQVSVSDA